MKEKERDAQIVERVQSGDKGSFEKLVGIYEGKIYGFLSKMCGNPDIAQDVLQETFL